MSIALSLVLGYLLGSIPVGLLVGRLAKGIDIREYGSGKTGAANVLRTLGVKYTVVVLLGDLGKGAGAVAIVMALANSDSAETAAGLGAMVGHVWPLYVGFKGGRGVFAGLGGFFVAQPVIAATALAVALITIGASRYVSVGSVVGALAMMLFAITARVIGKLSVEHMVFALVGSFLIVIQHKENIIRLRKGTERRLGQAAEGLAYKPK